MEMEMEKNRARILDDLKVLPPEIIIEILSRLPADSAIGCRLICKQWRSLIDHPFFVDTHTSQVISSSPFNPKKFGNYLIPNSSASSYGFFLCVQQHHRDYSYQFEFIEYNEGSSYGEEKSALEFKPSKPSKPITDHPFPFYRHNRCSLVTGSCNGLVFMGPTKPDDIFICNPFTREYVNLGHPTLEEEEEEWQLGSGGLGMRSKCCYMTYGFGYHPSTNEYKIVSIHYDNMQKRGGGKVSVYTVGSGKWRNKREIPYSLYNYMYSAGALANGTIYWYTYNYEIVSFDLADEEFKEVVPKLQQPAASTNCIDQYGVLGGCSCVTRSDNTSPKEIWVLNIHNNNKELSWNKKFSIPWKHWEGLSLWIAPQVVLKSGKILLRTGTNCFVSYDPKTEAFNGNIFPCNYGDRIIPYTKSFVSLKALGEEDAKCWLEVCCP